MQLDVDRDPSWWSVMVALADVASCDHAAFDDTDNARWATLVSVTERVLTDRPAAGPRTSHLRAINDLAGTDDRVAAHAVTWAVDRACHGVFTDGWIQHRPDAFTLDEGDWYPVPSWDGPGSGNYSRNPSNFPLSGEFPHTRRYRPDAGVFQRVDIVFDGTHEIELAAALESVDVLASVHPNGEWSELTFRAGASAYPVAPMPADQLERIRVGVSDALAADAGLVVVGELSSTAEIEAAMAVWLSSQRYYGIVVAGTRHTLTDGQPSNLATTHIGGVQVGNPTLTHRKIIPFTSDSAGQQPSREGIVAGPRLIHVHVAGNYRFATLICKDFLDQDVRTAVARAGVNVIAVPAMSIRMDSYPTEVASYVLGGQGVAVVANNPCHGPTGRAIEPAAVFGQPAAGNEAVESPPVAERDGRNVVLFQLEGTATWISGTQVLD